MNRPKSRYVVDLPKHLADCECNYYRLLKLMPDLQSNTGSLPDTVEWRENRALTRHWRYSISGFNSASVRCSLELGITIGDIAKYTTMLTVCVSPMPSAFTHIRANKPVVVSQGRDLLSRLHSYTLHVRLYHDAQLAEVVSSKGCLQFNVGEGYPNKDMYQRDEKFQCNQFLGELIVFCLAQGRVAYTVINA